MEKPQGALDWVVYCILGLILLGLVVVLPIYTVFKYDISGWHLFWMTPAIAIFVLIWKLHT
jgi:hypothetical protein